MSTRGIAFRPNQTKRTRENIKGMQRRSERYFDNIEGEFIPVGLLASVAKACDRFLQSRNIEPRSFGVGAWT